MNQTKRILLLLNAIGLNILLSVPAPAETITLETYYPAPFGAYDRLQLVPRGLLGNGDCNQNTEGQLYIDSSHGRHS